MNKVMLSLRRFIGTKSFYKELFLVAAPIAAQQFFTAIVNSFDTLMVANWGGVAATAGVTLANKYYLVVNMLSMAIAISCAVFVAQYYGAKRFDRLKQIFGLNIIMMVVLVSFAAAFGFIFKNEIISFLFGTSEATPAYNYAISYLSIILFSFIPHSITNAFAMTFRPLKMATVPLYSAIIASIVNVILNYFLIYGVWIFPELGVAGAAIATIVARVIELFVLYGYYQYSKPAFYGRWREIFAIPKFLVTDVITRLRPVFVASFLTEAMGIFMLLTYARIELGNSANIAAIAVSQQILDILMVIVMGMGTASSVLVGQRLGANLIEEARDNARWQLSYVMSFAFVASALMIILVPFAQRLYNFQDSETELLRMIMILQAVSFPFSIFAANVIFITRAGGFTKSAIYINNLVYYLFKLPLIVFLVYINRNFFNDFPFIQSFMISLGLVPSFIVFVFLVERFIELIRFIVATYIYTNIHWYNNITRSI
jgi:putative MATE family efflux protein